MKTFIAILLFCSFGILHSFAQVNSDSTLKPIKKKSNSADRLILNLYDDLWQKNPSGISVKGYSPGFDVYGMGNIPFGKSDFSLGIGVGFSTHNFRSDATPTDTANGPQTYFSKIPTTVFNVTTGNNYNVTVNNNKLSLTYAEIPIEFRFRHITQKKKAIKVAIGGNIGYLIGDHTKYKGTYYETGNPYYLSNVGTTTVKFKTYNISNLNPLEYAATVRIGYGIINLFATYSFSTTFKDNKGPQMFPVSVGISVTPF